MSAADGADTDRPVAARGSARDRPRRALASTPLVGLAWLALRPAALLIELFRVVHAPWLDAFRVTTAGALRLGHVFPPWNMPSFATGIATARGLDRLWPARHPAHDG